MKTQISSFKSNAYANMKVSVGNEPPTLKLDPELKSFAERLKSVIADESVRSFARRCDLSETSVRKYLGATADPARSILVKMAKAGRVSVEWLATGEGPREIDGEVARPAPMGDVNADEFDYVGFYDVVASAGPGAVVDEERVVQRLAFRKDWLRRQGFNPRNLALLTAKGDSMEGTVPDGATVLVERFDPPQDVANDGIYVLRWDDHLVIKRLQRHIDGSIDIISDNPRYGKQHIPKSRTGELQVAGRVAWIGHEI